MKIVDINGITRECIEIKPDKNFPGYFAVTFPSKRNPAKTLTEWFPIADFKRLNPGLKEQAKLAIPAPDISGVVTKGNENYLKDTTQKWISNCYTGFTVWISRGQGEGQTRTVMRNTKTCLFIDRPWDILPDKSSQYVVSRDIHNPPAMENQLPKVVD